MGLGAGPHRGFVNTRGSLAGMLGGWRAGAQGRQAIQGGPCHTAPCVRGGPGSASRRHRGLSYTICRFTLWPTSSRMLLMPYLIIVGLGVGRGGKQF